jgi:hypothetical protein
MALTDTFVKNTKPTDSPAGDKYRDGGGMYLLINKGGKYWRMDYRFAEKRKTLALGVYPAVTLAKARQRRDKARELLAEGVDPGTAKREAKAAEAAQVQNTFERVARDWLDKTAADRMASTQGKVTITGIRILHAGRRGLLERARWLGLEQHRRFPKWVFRSIMTGHSGLS